MRNKLIITGAIGVMAAATLTAQAENGAQRAVHAKPTSAVALSHAVNADRDDLTIAARATASAAAAAIVASKPAEPEAEESSKPETHATPATTPAGLSASCQAAIANLKAMRQADIAEDAAERANATSWTAASIAADRAEDAAEAQSWAPALMAARTNCAPQVPTACRTALTGLQAALLALHTAELAEAPGAETDWATDFAPLRTAFSGIAAACATRE